MRMATNIKKLTLYPDKDFDIIRLCELITQTDDVNFSELTTFAVEYYLKTGEYITIGHVLPKEYDKTHKMTPKNIYVKKGSLFEQWANENKGVPGFTLTNRVRDILHSSIRLVGSNEEESIISLYNVILELRKATADIHKPIYNIPIPVERTNTIPVIKETVVEQTEVSSKKEEVKTSQDSATKARDSALSSSFLGGRTLKFSE